MFISYPSTEIKEAKLKRFLGDIDFRYPVHKKIKDKKYIGNDFVNMYISRYRAKPFIAAGGCLLINSSAWLMNTDEASLTARVY